MILEAKKVCKSFGKLDALVDVDMAVEEGEVFGIAGPNGAGKSTLFNVITGTYPLSTGSVIFDGHDITGMKAHRVCLLGLGRTFQVPKTFPTLSVYDNLRVGATFGIDLKGNEREEKITDCLNFLGLMSFRSALATNLDLYTTKLVMLGSALATGCKVLMLDEPLGGFSAAEIAKFLEIIYRLNKERGITAIIIEHILDTLIDISDRMLILHNGQVIYVGNPGGVRQHEKVIEVYLGKEEKHG
jgi:branched-chain amino acid transport system ATP-binding protein